MNRLRRWSVVACLYVCAPFLLLPMYGQVPTAPAQGQEKWLIDRTLTLTPKPEIVPGLKYRLYPSLMDRKEGNAVPIYLRFAHERNDATKQLLKDKTHQWNELPLDKLPLSEVHPFLDTWKYNLRQLELGARRRTAEWNYTLDSGGVIELLLPDMHEMRLQAGLLALKARVEIAEGKWDDAIQTLETGFSMSQQVGQAPFLICSLVGIATGSQFTDCLIEWTQRPDSPNLYWALTNLPRPLIDLRHGIEFEERVVELEFPDMVNLDRPRSAAHWDAALARVRTMTERLLSMDETARTKKVKPGVAASDPAANSPELPDAKKYLVEKAGMSKSDVDAMPPAQALMLYLYAYGKEFRADYFKLATLPFPQAYPLLAAAQQRLKSIPETEAGRFAWMFCPNLYSVSLAQVRLERRIDCLRVIEALRIHAAANGGELPESLNQVKVVPVPNDPGTGQPFEYHREGSTATLVSRIAAEPTATTGIRFRLTIRK